MSHRIAVGACIEATESLGEASIAEFARLSGDLNPLHHDRDFARKGPFGGIIACGPHYASRLMGLAATHFSKFGTMLGLEFDLKFRRAVRADELLHLRWRVENVEEKPSLKGDLIQIEGGIYLPDRTPILLAQGTILVIPHPIETHAS